MYIFCFQMNVRIAIYNQKYFNHDTFFYYFISSLSVYNQNDYDTV